MLMGSHLGNFAVVTVGRINNIDELVQGAFSRRATHFSELGGGEINPTELVATLISEATVRGGHHAQEAIEGSCSLLLLTDEGHLRRPRPPGPHAHRHRPEATAPTAATLETCALPNLDYEIERYLGPGEIVVITPDGIEQLKPPGRADADLLPSSGSTTAIRPRSYEGINVEAVRNRCGAALARDDDARSTWWPAFPTRAPATPSATPTRRAFPTAARS